MKYLVVFFKNFGFLFRSNSFKNQPYTWLANQFGHYWAGFLLAVALFVFGNIIPIMFFNYTDILLRPLACCIIVTLAWILWEVRGQIKEGANHIDSIEDLFFELSGTWSAIYFGFTIGFDKAVLYFFIHTVIVLLVLAILTGKRL